MPNPKKASRAQNQPARKVRHCQRNQSKATRAKGSSAARVMARAARVKPYSRLVKAAPV